LNQTLSNIARCFEAAEPGAASDRSIETKARETKAPAEAGASDALPAAIWAKAPGDVKSYRGTLNASSIPGQNQKFGSSGGNDGLAISLRVKLPCPPPNSAPARPTLLNLLNSLCHTGSGQYVKGPDMHANKYDT
jgi:hypothetical protein